MTSPTDPTIETFDFHGDALAIASTPDGERWAVLARLCEPLGLDVSSQRAKLAGAPWARTVIITAHDATGRNQALFCLNLRSLAGWLFSVNAGKVRPELREKLARYQAECADVLADHFLGKRGAAPLPTPAEPAHQPFDAESLARAMAATLGAVIAPLVARLDAIEASRGVGAGIVDRRVAKSICSTFARIAAIQVRSGQAKSLRSARAKIENAVRGTIGWAGTGRSWDRLPTEKYGPLLAELETQQRTAEAIELDRNERRQTTLNLSPGTSPSCRPN